MAAQALVAPELGQAVAAQVLVVVRAMAVLAELVVQVGVVDLVAPAMAVQVEVGQVQEQRPVQALVVVPLELAWAARALARGLVPQLGQVLGQVLVLELVQAPGVVPQEPPVPEQVVVPASAGQARAPRREPGQEQALERALEREPAWERGPRLEVARLLRPRHPWLLQRPARPCQQRPRRPP